MQRCARLLEAVVVLAGLHLATASGVPVSFAAAAPEPGCSIALGASSSSPPAAKPFENAPARRAMISFSGYQRLPEGRGRLFIHLSARPELMVMETGGTEQRYRLVDTDIGVRNNRHPLELREFDDLLVRSQLTPSGDDVILALRLRRAAELQYEFVELDDGRVSLQIDLPPR